MQVAAVILIWHNWSQNTIVIIAGILCGMDVSTYKEGYDIPDAEWDFVKTCQSTGWYY